MNCQEFWNGPPEAARRPDHVAHLRDCASCARLSERQSQLAAGLRAMAAESGQVGAPTRVEARLIAAYRNHAGMGNRVPTAIRAPRMWVPVATWFASAAAVVALAFVLINGHGPQAVHRNLPSTLESAMAQSPADLDVEDSPYNSGDFIPLPNAQRIAPNEDVNLVRVEVPRSTMIALGYDVSADRASEPVEAEVVLGPDGLARAVRFLE